MDWFNKAKDKAKDAYQRAADRVNEETAGISSKREKAMLVGAMLKHKVVEKTLDTHEALSKAAMEAHDQVLLMKHGQGSPQPAEFRGESAACIRIAILSAADLKPEAMGELDPYCLITVGRQGMPWAAKVAKSPHAKLPVCLRERHPRWNVACSLPLSPELSEPTAPAELTVRVMNAHATRADSVLGEVRVRLTEEPAGARSLRLLGGGFASLSLRWSLTSPLGVAGATPSTGGLPAPTSIKPSLTKSDLDLCKQGRWREALTKSAFEAAHAFWAAYWQRDPAARATEGLSELARVLVGEEACSPIPTPSWDALERQLSEDQQVDAVPASEMMGLGAFIGSSEDWPPSWGMPDDQAASSSRPASAPTSFEPLPRRGRLSDPSPEAEADWPTTPASSSRAWPPPSAAGAPGSEVPGGLGAEATPPLPFGESPPPLGIEASIAGAFGRQPSGCGGADTSAAASMVTPGATEAWAQGLNELILQAPLALILSGDEACVKEVLRALSSQVDLLRPLARSRTVGALVAKLNAGKFTGHLVEFAEDLIYRFLVTSVGKDLQELKTLIDTAGTGNDLMSTFAAVSRQSIHAALLKHFRAEARRSEFRTTHVLSDIDMTVWVGTFGTGGPKFPAGPIPGAISLFGVLGGRITFLSARPPVWESRTRSKLLNDIGIAEATVLRGTLQNIALALVDPTEAHKGMGEQKTKEFGRFAQIHPEARWIFFGDSGEGDVEFAVKFASGAAASAKLPPDRVALIHDVVAEDGVTPKTSEKRRQALTASGVYVFDTYIGAAERLYHLKVIDEWDLRQFAQACSDEFAEIPANTYANRSVYTARTGEMQRDLESVTIALSVRDSVAPAASAPMDSPSLAQAPMFAESPPPRPPPASLRKRSDMSSDDEPLIWCGGARG